MTQAELRSFDELKELTDDENKGNNARTVILPGSSFPVLLSLVYSWIVNLPTLRLTRTNQTGRDDCGIGMATRLLMMGLELPCLPSDHSFCESLRHEYNNFEFMKSFRDEKMYRFEDSKC